VRGIPFHRSLVTATRGFTLVELVTTITLLGILAAVAVPRFMDSDDTFAQRGYADEIASALRHARAIAVATQCEVQVVVNAANYIVRQRDTLADCNNAGSPWNTPVRREDGSSADGSASSGVYVAAPTQIVFEDNGTIAVPPAVISIGPFSVSIDPQSGIVTVST
jgi:prepilin-type N-terminal cleavage/methylation domain-containing protein